MNSKCLLAAMVTTVAFTLSMHADDYTNNNSLSYEQNSPLMERYQANEFILRLVRPRSGNIRWNTWRARFSHTVRQDTKFGAGAGHFDG